MKNLGLALVVVASSLFFACGGEPAKEPSNSTTSAPSSAPAPTTPAATSVATPAATSANSAAQTAPANSAQAAPADSTALAAPPVAAASARSSPVPPPATKKEEPITSVRVYLSNKCPKKVEYCVEDGSTLNTSLTGNTSTTHTVKPGAKFRLKNGSSCGATVFTAPVSKDEVKASICEK